VHSSRIVAIIVLALAFVLLAGRGVSDDKNVTIVPTFCSVNTAVVTPVVPLRIAAGAADKYTDAVALDDRNNGASAKHSAAVSVIATGAFTVPVEAQVRYQQSSGAYAWHSVVPTTRTTLTAAGDWAFKLDLPTGKWCRLKFSADATMPVTFNSIAIVRE
jgi:hypothetical protein